MPKPTKTKHERREDHEDEESIVDGGHKQQDKGSLGHGGQEQSDNKDNIDHGSDNDGHDADSKEDDNDKQDEEDKAPQKLRKVHKLSLEKTEDFNKKLRRRGVIYVARVPPRMTPTKLKSLLSQFGEVTRVYLVEEDKSVQKRRRKMTGNGSKRFTEGWVEFASKKVAAHVAASLNTTPISNHKRNVHYGDLWNLKYLHKFKWSHLTEKVAYERRVREQKLRLETLQARKETAAYKQLVETGKKLDKIEERRRKRAEREGKDDTNTTTATLNPSKRQRKTKQLRPLHDGTEKSASKVVIGALL